MGCWYHAGQDRSASESSSEDEDGEESEQLVEQTDSDDAEVAGPSGVDQQEPSSSSKPAKKDKISISLAGLACHVCGKRGHNAGFVGSVYMDCPNKPCYLCKKPGHTTMTCPYRLAPDHDCTPASTAGHHGILASLLQRSHDNRQLDLRSAPKQWQIDAAVLKLHLKRCTCLQFHPTRDNLVLSGDKAGQVAVWDHIKVYERTVWRPNEALTNNLAFLPSADGMACCSSSADGTLKVIDLETGLHKVVLNMNPDGWIGQPSKWIMLYGLDVCKPRSLITVGDTRGAIHFVDARCDKKVASHQLHKTGNKVNSVCFSSVDEDLFVTGSNDWTARLCDIRLLSSNISSARAGKGKDTAQGPLQISSIDHPKVVNSASFSPTTGKKLMTTCIDNRIRVWDYLLAVDKPPSQEIVHSHDFNRYLTPFRAEWDPKDSSERLIAIGRYISEDFSGVALHPVDLFDVGTGKLLDQLTDPNLTTICPVNKIHPRLDMIVSGSSSSLYAWRPVTEGLDAIDSEKEAVAPAALEGGLQRSADFVYFDASGDGAEKRKRKAATNASAPASKQDAAKPRKAGGKKAEPQRSASPEEDKVKESKAVGKQGKPQKKKK